MAVNKVFIYSHLFIRTWDAQAEMTEQDEQITRNYLRSSSPLEYEFTRDEALLHQYYRIREQAFIHRWGLEYFHAEKDYIDEISDILIVRKGKLCVGGARLTFSTPENHVMLPMEGADFNLRNVFPELTLNSAIYAECTRMAVLPEFRTKEITQKLQYHVVQRHIERHAQYGFWIAPILVARNNRQSGTNLGVHCKIRMDIKIPEREEYEGIKMYLGVMDFTPVNPLPQNLAQAPALA